MRFRLPHGTAFGSHGLVVRTQSWTTEVIAMTRSGPHGPSTPQPTARAKAGSCVSPRCRPSAFPIRSPVHAGSAIRKRSLARGAAAITRRIRSSPRSSWPSSVTWKRNTAAPTSRRCPDSPPSKPGESEAQQRPGCDNSPVVPPCAAPNRRNVVVLVDQAGHRGTARRERPGSRPTGLRLSPTPRPQAGQHRAGRRRSVTPAAHPSTIGSRPRKSVTTCRHLPLIFSPPS